jgi:DNA-binding IclR family transcriptional regulator
MNECRRSDAGAINHAIAWQTALSEGLYASPDELAEQLGLHKSTVSRVISLLDLPTFVTDAMKKNPERVGIRLGMALIQYHGAFGMRSLTRLVDRIFVATRQEVTATAVEVAVASGTHFESTRGFKPQRYPIFVNKREGRRNGALRMYPSGRLVLDVAFDDLTIQEQVGEAIRAVFERQYVPR